MSSTFDARTAAQTLAFGPMAFQAARVLRDAGVLAFARERGDRGFDRSEAVEASGLSDYALAVLLDSGTSIGLLTLRDDGRYRLAPTGLFVLKDEMTRVNMDFVHDVCFLGAHALEASLREGRPAGLEVFGQWGTVYEALAELPPHVRKSWFGFDHYYSDAAFPEVLPLVLERRPRRLLDCGGNTGRWARRVLQADPDVRVTLLDHPGQLANAREQLGELGLLDRLDTVPIDFLDPSAALPGGHDVLWMSQFLDCFSEDEIVSILTRACEAMDEGARLFVLETYWDRQKQPTAAYVLAMTSIYFATIANGNSRMYHASDLRRCAGRAGLRVESEVDGLGVGHTLMTLVRA
ncbi:MAG: SAM-dependent methyltransferase [Alphaproteobacteria bacterium]|nr:SAM-dependent methyltransferase [Alphaproteobacteria bacterium]MCB9697312.1 SAM-dependent methyltransferase [Alphaproteobacteria bacterium]